MILEQLCSRERCGPGIRTVHLVTLFTDGTLCHVNSKPVKVMRCKMFYRQVCSGKDYTAGYYRFSLK